MSNSFNKRGTQKNSITMKTTFHSNSTETRYHERRGWHLDDKEGKDRKVVRDLKILQRELRVSGGFRGLGGSGGSCPGSLDKWI